jgi:ketosteroid isomerase-like protein
MNASAEGIGMDNIFVETQKIHDLIARYADAITQREWRNFGDFYTEDAYWEVLEPFNFSAKGRDEIVKTIFEARSRNEFVTQLPHAVVVDYRGGDSAVARHTLLNIAASPRGTGYTAIGIFSDELRRQGGVWRFQRRSFAPGFFDSEPPRGIVMQCAMTPKSPPDFDL